MRLMILSLITGLLVGGISVAQTAPVPANTQPERLANGSQFGGWTVVCEALAVNETACLLSQRLLRGTEGTLLVDLVAFPEPDESGGVYLAARVPNGVYLPHGFAMKPSDASEEEETRLVWQSCTPQLCEALLLLDPVEMSTLEAAGGDLIAGYRPRLGEQPLVFAMNLSGLAEGVAALRAASIGSQ